ncbi:MAG: PEP/pyruvate-binding domain-containing protein [Halanaerobiales bacterium]
MKNLKYIKYFKEISKKDLSRVGGKGANLGEMMVASLPVPDGFVLVVDSYNEFLSENNLYSKIDNILESININQFAEIEKGAKKIQDIFNDAKIPIEICAEIDKAYQKIGNSRVAVRSSATMEDSPETSFAGQFDSFLNVEGKEELYKNIKNCWGSLWNSRALSYRIKQNIGNDDLAHGVVVQKLIEAEKSGIIFTANPVNGRRDQLLLNSSWGLGESIVCGDVRADQWIIDKDSFDIIEKDIGSKEIMAVCKGDGTEYIVTPAAKRNQASLEEDEIIGLVKLAQKTEKHYGHPQDIEWAYHNGEFYLLQTRPITTLFPVSGIRDNNDGLRVYMNFMLNNQVMHEPLTPMGEETWKMAIKSTILNKRYRKESVSWLKSIAGRLFIDVTELSRFERCWGFLENNPTDMDPLTTKAMLQVFERNKAELKKQRKSIIKIFIGMLKKMNPAFIKFLITSIPKAVYGYIFPTDKVVAKAHEHGKKRIRSIEKKRKNLSGLWPRR